MEDLNNKGVAVEFSAKQLRFCLGVDDLLAKLQLHILPAIANWVRRVAKIRQAEGIARAKELHPKKDLGHSKPIDIDKVNARRDDGLGRHRHLSVWDRLSIGLPGADVV